MQVQNSNTYLHRTSISQEYFDAQPVLILAQKGKQISGIRHLTSKKERQNIAKNLRRRKNRAKNP